NATHEAIRIAPTTSIEARNITALSFQVMERPARLRLEIPPTVRPSAGRPTIINSTSSPGISRRSPRQTASTPTTSISALIRNRRSGGAFSVGGGVDIDRVSRKRLSVVRFTTRTRRRARPQRKERRDYRETDGQGQKLGLEGARVAR